MELVILLIVMSVLGAFTIKCMKNEDAIMELEDKIIADFREFFKGSKAQKKSVKNDPAKIVRSNDHAHNHAA